MAYPSIADLVAASSIDELTSADAAEKGRLYRSSISAVEDYCRQSFDHWTGTKMIDGGTDRQLFLPRRLSSLTGLAVARSVITERDVDLSEDHDEITLKPDAGRGGNYYERCAADADERMGLGFTFGYDTVAVTGVWGWADDEFPQLVFDALLKDMEDTAQVDTNKLTPTIRQYRHMGIRNISQGNMRAQISGAPGLSADSMGLLSGLIWDGPLGALA